jgi:hypothetical protein
MKRLSPSLLLCVSFLCAVPAVADQIIGLPPDPNAGNCYPFGCSYSAEYQQVYTASAFAGPLTIRDLEFFNTQFNSGAIGMNSGTWIISLSTTSADWNTLSSNFASNIGGDDTRVFKGNLHQPWAFGDTLHIYLTTPFTYDPENGNLLMDITVSGASANGGNIYFDTNGYNDGGFNGNTIMGRVFCFGGDCASRGAGVTSGFGLVTGFTITGEVPIPEPSSILLLCSGLAALWSGARRSKRVASAPG